MDRDVQDEEFLSAMLYVRKNIEKGPMLCAAMFQALKQENAGLRQQGALRTAELIRRWAGMG